MNILSRLTPRDHVGPAFTWVFKIPVAFYKLGLGWILGKRLLLLTAAGRKTGKFYYTPLECGYIPQGDRYRVTLGWGSNMDWYKNIRYNPHVIVQVGRLRLGAVAEPAFDEVCAEFMLATS